MLIAVRDHGQAGVAAVQFFVALVLVAPLHLVSLHRIGVGARSVLTSVPLPSAAGVVVWIASWGLARSIAAPFLAAASAGVIAVVVITALAFWQRDNLRLLRSAARQGAT